MMNNNFSQSRKNQTSKLNQFPGFFKEPSIERRRQEIERRILGLQVRRNHLESELRSINNCLLSLDKQMNKFLSFHQLTLRD